MRWLVKIRQSFNISRQRVKLFMWGGCSSTSRKWKIKSVNSLSGSAFDHVYLESEEGEPSKPFNFKAVLICQAFSHESLGGAV